MYMYILVRAVNSIMWVGVRCWTVGWLMWLVGGGWNKNLGWKVKV